MGRDEIIMLMLLDTHAWIWYFKGEERLRQSQSFDKIETSIAQNLLFISAISVWELGMLVAKKKIALNEDALIWTNKTLTRKGMNLAALSPEIAIESNRLPGSFHSDPADRILVATARLMDIPLVTADDEIIEYGKLGFVKVVPI